MLMRPHQVTDFTNFSQSNPEVLLLPEEATTFLFGKWVDDFPVTEFVFYLGGNI